MWVARVERLWGVGVGPPGRKWGAGAPRGGVSPPGCPTCGYQVLGELGGWAEPTVITRACEGRALGCNEGWRMSPSLRVVPLLDTDPSAPLSACAHAKHPVSPPPPPSPTQTPALGPTDPTSCPPPHTPVPPASLTPHQPPGISSHYIRSKAIS